MRRLATALLASTLALAGLSACSTGSEAVTDVQASDVDDVLTADPGATVIDVRSPAEFAAGHLEGAVNIDVSSPSFEQEIAALPQDGTYLVYCQSGNRSGTATDTMADAGFTEVYDLQGGVVAWQAAGGALVRD